MSGLIDVYKSCSPLEKSILQLLTAANERLIRKDLRAALEQLEIRDEHAQPFNQKTLSAALRGLEQRKLVEILSGSVSCAPEITHICLKDCLTTGQFISMSETLLKLLPAKGSWGGYSFKHYARLLRHLRYRIFCDDDWDKLNEIVDSGTRYFSREINGEDPLLTIFNHPFDGELLTLAPMRVRGVVLSLVFNQAWRQLEGVEPVFAFLRQGCRQPDDPLGREGGGCGLFFTYYRTLWGYWREAAEIMSALPPEDRRPGLSGWHLALAGRDKEAIDSFAADHARLVKTAGKRKVFFQDISGIFYLIALVRSGGAAHLATAREYLQLIESKKDHALRTYCYPLRQAINLLSGGELESLEQLRDVRADNPCQHFFYILAYYWRDKIRCRQQWTDALVSCRDRALKAGMVWLASESAELLARLGVEIEKNASLAKGIREQQGIVSVIDMVRLVAPWERRLRALISLGSQAKPAERASGSAVASAQRLVWRLFINQRYDQYSLIPRLQTLSKTGKWSAGRPAALKTLQDKADKMEGLSGQDRAVCAAIKTVYEGGSYGYGRREVQTFDMGRALTALVGHPRIVLDDAGDCPIDLVAGEPELVVTRGSGGIEVRMQPEFKADKDYRLLKETPTRYKLVRFGAQHQAIAAVLSSGIKAPGQAEAMATEVINALSPLITIHSDLAGATDAREVEADPRPYLHLLPYQDGLKAELMVKPFAAAEAWFRPGLGGQKVFAEVGGEKLSAVRDLQRERALALEAVRLCPTLASQEENDGEYVLPGPKDSLELLLELREAGDQVAVAWPQGESLRLRGRASMSAMSMQIKRDRDWFKASGSLALDEGGVIALQKLLSLLDQAQGRFVRLDDGSFLALTAEFKSRLEELKSCGELRADGLRFSPFAALGLGDLGQEAGELACDRHWKGQIARFQETVDPEVPSTLQAELRDYQLQGFKWLAQLAHWGVGACLADDMGLGKTIQALAVILRLAPDGPTLVVAPLSVLMNWQDEARRFAPTLRVIFFGPGDRKQTLLALTAFDLVVCSYGLLQTEAELLAQVEWQAIVLDEAQAIKNMHTKRSQAAMNLNGRFKLITTGTPVENHLGELWNLFDFITPGLLGSLAHFSRNFMTTASPEEGRKAMARLKRLIQPFILRRLKSQVLQELPARTEVTMRVEMSSEEAALYEAQRRKALETLTAVGGEPQGQQQIRILAEIMRLRRLCCNPALVLPGSRIESSKLRVFGELLDDILGNRHKALVFSQFVDHLAILSDFLKKRGVSFQYLDGSTPVAARRQRINDFQAGQGDVFLISLKAGGSGLNLTAADYVIHMDPWWNPAVEDQASDRAHRIGQQRPVTIYRLVVADSIEEQIIKLHQEKRDLADSLLSGGDLSAKMSAAELLALLRERE